MPSDPYRIAVIVLSDRAASGVRPDGCIPVIRDVLGDAYAIEHEAVIADDPAALQAALIELCDRGIAAILTSGWYRTRAARSHAASHERRARL